MHSLADVAGEAGHESSLDLALAVRMLPGVQSVGRGTIASLELPGSITGKRRQLEVPINQQHLEYQSAQLR
jgi:hypothetical protein